MIRLTSTLICLSAVSVIARSSEEGDSSIPPSSFTLSPPVDSAGYYQYSEILAGKAGPVDKAFGGAFGKFIATLKNWAPTIAGYAGGMFLGGLPIISFIIGPYTGAVLGSTAGALYATSKKLADKASLLLNQETSAEFKLATESNTKLASAVEEANKSPSASAFKSAEAYFSHSDNSTAEYKTALTNIYKPAAANLRLFWKTKEHVLTVLAGGMTMVDYFRSAASTAKAAGQQFLPELAYVIHQGIDSLLEIARPLMVGSAQLRKDLIEARAYLAVLDARDRLIRTPILTAKNAVIGGVVLGALATAYYKSHNWDSSSASITPEPVVIKRDEPVRPMRPVEPVKPVTKVADQSANYVLIASLSILIVVVIVLLIRRSS